MNDQWTERLSEYLDGELTGTDQAALEAHLPHCAECAGVLDELRNVVARARALDDRPPSHDLWQGVAALIGKAPAPAPAARPAVRVLRFPKVSFTVPQLAAAALALMLGSGAVVYRWAGNSRTVVASLEPGAEIPVSVRAAAALGSERLDSTVAGLERALGEGQGMLDTSTVRIIRQNLAIIDAAILQARRALSADPANVYLNNHLAGTMKRKVELLRRAALLTTVRS
ncbi:MAG: zf-HC2 domain-containing protein [Gemmatimonadetes bacterium]|nr:zf-HC2 domain-containing protein [Gemmatimonadota bacterium]